MAIFGRFLLQGNVADVYNILSCVKNFNGVNFFNRDYFFNALINTLIRQLYLILILVHMPAAMVVGSDAQ